MLWVELCNFFDPVKYGKFDTVSYKWTHPSSSARKTRLEQIFQTHRAGLGSDMWTIMSLLLPGYDKRTNGDRATYGIGAKGIATMIIKALDLAADGVYAHRLLNWDNDKGGEGHGDLPRVVYKCLMGREHRKFSHSVLTVEQVDRFLTGLRDSDTPKVDKQRAFTDMINTSTPIEIKWIVAEILVEDIPLSREDVLSAYHPDAINLMNYNTDLRELTKLLSNADAVVHPTLTLMKAFTPMCSRQLMQEKNLKEWFPGVFWAEEKFDGERIQIHKDGDIIRMFSRNAVDYTNLFSSAIRMIIDNHALKANKCILDGEILAWDNFHGCFGRCSAVKTAAVATGGVMPHANLQTTRSRNRDDGQWAIALRLFDVLQIEDQCTMNMPLYERHTRLTSIVTEISNLLQVTRLLTVPDESDLLRKSDTHELTTYDQAVRVMCSVVDSGAEGVVLKDPESYYQLGTRVNSRWVKFKPDYFENGGIGGNGDLDLLVVGAACGMGEGHLTHYLLALAADTRYEMEKPEQFFSFTHICKYISKEQSRKLELIFKEHKVRVDFRKKHKIYTYNTPAVKFEWRNEKERQHVLVTWLKTEELPRVQVIYSGRHNEDVHWVFDPRRSVLVAVNADPRPIESTTFATEYTLRFPRLHPKGVRDPAEKAWYQCLQKSEWDALMEAGSSTGAVSPAGAASSRNQGLGELNRHVNVMKRKSQNPHSQIKPPTVIGRHDRQDDKRLSEMLEGWSVYIHRNSFAVRDDLMRKAAELGAKTWECNPQTGTKQYDHERFAGISTNTTSPEFEACKRKNLDVVSSKWLIDCWEKAQKDPLASPIDLSLSYMLNTSSE